MSSNKDICPICENQVKEEGLGCENCEFWFHITCVNISKEQYNFISQKEELLFVCKSCKVKSKKSEDSQNNDTNNVHSELLAQMSLMMQKMNQIVESNENMARSNTDLENRVSKLENKEDKGPKEEQVKDLVEKSLEDILDNKVNEALREAKEQESRRLNLILVNVPESKGENKTKEDKEKVDKLIKRIVPEEDVKIEQVVRIGEANDNRYRLLKIKVENMDIKRKILKNSKLINEPDIKDPKKKIYVNIDYTKKERDLNKALRDELKAMPAEKRDKYTIKYNRIVLKEDEPNKQK